jgi:alpha-tubulin suppressor-like RCC1 family protein
MLDTRTGLGVDQQIGATLGGFASNVQVLGTQPAGGSASDGVPLGIASAIVINATVTQPLDSGYVSVTPLSAHPALVSTLNHAAGETRANAAIVTPGLCGQLSFKNGSARKAQLVGDVLGYFLSTANPAVSPVRSWGGNLLGGLADGGFDERLQPGDTVGLGDVVDIAANEHGLGRTADGVVMAWGPNTNGELGFGFDALRDEGRDGCSIPSATFFGGAAAIAAGPADSYVLEGNSSISAWGANDVGQLGDGGSAARSSPQQVPGLTGVTAIAAGQQFVLVLKNDGTVWGWGRERFGELGGGDDVQRRPRQIAGLSGVTAIAATDFTGLALLADGTVRSWGNNQSGSLGNNTTADSSAHPTPVTVTGLTGVTQLIGGPDATPGAVLSDGTVKMWGDNTYGELGNTEDNGTPQYSSLPVTVVGLDHVGQVAGGNFGSAAVISGGPNDGQVWVWGSGVSRASAVDGLTGIAKVSRGLESTFAFPR